MEFNNELFDRLLSEASVNPRLRTNLDLRGSSDDSSQRMLNALLPGTVVPVHCHPNSPESVVCLRGKLEEVLYSEDGDEISRIVLCPEEGCAGCQVPAGVWHSVNVIAPSVIIEMKDRRYGEDGSRMK